MGVNAFQKLLERMEEPDRATVTSLTTKYAWLPEAVATQEELAGIKANLTDDLTKTKNRFAELQTAFTQSQEAVGKYKTWEDTYWDPSGNGTKLEVEQSKKIDQLTREAEILRSLGGGEEVDLAQLQKELDARLATLPYAKAGDLANYADKTTLQQVIATAQAELAGRTGTFIAEAMPLMQRHKDEWNEILDLNPIAQKSMEMSAAYGGVPVPLTTAYNEIMKDRFATRATEQTKKREDEVRADERRKVLQERGMGETGRPDDTGMFGAPLGNVQRAAEAKPDAAKPDFSPGAPTRAASAEAIALMVGQNK